MQSVIILNPATYIDSALRGSIQDQLQQVSRLIVDQLPTTPELSLTDWTQITDKVETLPEEATSLRDLLAIMSEQVDEARQMIPDQPLTTEKRLAQLVTAIRQQVELVDELAAAIESDPFMKVTALKGQNASEMATTIREHTYRISQHIYSAQQFTA